MLRDISNGGRLWRIILYSFLFSILGGMLQGFGLLMFKLAGADVETSVWAIRFGVIIQDIFVFGLPVFVVFQLSYLNPVAALGMHKETHVKQLLLMTFILYIVVTPLISVLGSWNQQIQFPAALKGLEDMMQRMEAQAEGVYELFFSNKSVVSLIFNIIIVAAMAAFFEEVLFRGGIQQLLHRITGNGHAAVWITAVIFSTIHLQFYGFFPRIIMGAVMGYLFLITKNLWLPIFYHFVNNAIAVVMKTYFDDNTVVKQMEEFKPNMWHWLLAAISLWLTYHLFKLMYRCYGAGRQYRAALKPIEQPITPAAPIELTDAEETTNSNNTNNI